MIAAGPIIAPVIPATLRTIERNLTVGNKHDAGCAQPKIKPGGILEPARL